MDKKKKRLFVVVGILGGLFILLMIVGAQSVAERTEYFVSNKGEIITEFKTALDADDLAECEYLVSEYGVVDDSELKVLISQYEDKFEAQEKADKLAKEQAKIESVTAKLGEPFRGDVLEITVKKVHITDNVGSFLLNEQSKKGVLYFAVDYSYKNISKSPTRESPELSMISPDGSTYSPDVSAGIAYASNNADYDEEVFSVLNPQVFSNGVEVFEVPVAIKGQDGWKLQIDYEGGGFAKGYVHYLNLQF